MPNHKNIVFFVSKILAPQDRAWFLREIPRGILALSGISDRKTRHRIDFGFFGTPLRCVIHGRESPRSISWTVFTKDRIQNSTWIRKWYYCEIEIRTTGHQMWSWRFGQLILQTCRRQYKEIPTESSTQCNIEIGEPRKYSPKIFKPHGNTSVNVKKKVFHIDSIVLRTRIWLFCYHVKGNVDFIMFFSSNLE